MPRMPDYGVDGDDWSPLPWAWAVERLVPTRNYWVVTVSAAGRPHSLPVWGVWDGTADRFLFSCSPRPRKARNLAANPHVVVTLDDTVECVSVEGRARVHRARRSERETWIDRYMTKYAGSIRRLDARVHPRQRDGRGRARAGVRRHRADGRVLDPGHPVGLRLSRSVQRRSRLGDGRDRVTAMGTPVVGFVGVGILGRPVAEELLAAGVELVVHDVVADSGRRTGREGRDGGVVGGRGRGALRPRARAGADRRPVPHGGGRGARDGGAGHDDRGDGDGDRPRWSWSCAGRWPRPARRSGRCAVRRPGRRQRARPRRCGCWPAGRPRSSSGSDRSWNRSPRPTGARRTARCRLHPEAGPQRDGVPRLSGGAWRRVELGHAAGVADGLVKEVTLASEHALLPVGGVPRHLRAPPAATRAAPPRRPRSRTYAALAEKDLAPRRRGGRRPRRSTSPGSRLVSTMGDRLYVVAPTAGREPTERGGPIDDDASAWRPPERAGPCSTGKPVAFVTTMRPDGHMSTNPMAVVLGDDGVIRLSTVTTRRKVRNLLADDRITICVVQPDNLNRYVEVRGRAVLDPDADRSFIDWHRPSLHGRGPIPVRRSRRRAGHHLRGARARVVPADPAGRRPARSGSERTVSEGSPGRGLNRPQDDRFRGAMMAT